MKTFDEAVRHDLAAAPQPASLDRLRRLTRRRRSRRVLSGAVPLLVVVIVVGFLLNSTQHSRGVEVSPSSTSAQSATTTTLDPRGATANVAYVKRLVTENRLPHASAVTRVRAETDEIVVSTSLTDTISAEELWEGLKLAIGCDDSFLGIKGYFVLLKDGARVDKPRYADFNCASGDGIPRATDCPLALQPAAGQRVVPVSVPCDCPAAPITTPPAGADEPADAARAALAWVSRAKHWAPNAGRVTAIYRVGDTSRGVCGAVFATNVPKFCGGAVTYASWVIELGDDQIHDTGRQAAVIVAHFAVGWQVWGVYT
jgi:hypothetical protein